MWNLETGQLLRTMLGHEQSVRCIEVAGNRVVSGSYDYTCRVSDYTLVGGCCAVVTADQIVSQSETPANDPTDSSSGTLTRASVSTCFEGITTRSTPWRTMANALCQGRSTRPSECGTLKRGE